jgi:hypothetical protein
MGQGSSVRVVTDNGALRSAKVEWVRCTRCCDMQDVSSGLPVAVTGSGVTSLYGMEVELAQAREELRAISGSDGVNKLNSALDGMGLGTWCS